jgi:myo-inositol-1(or 4)-monophosphatase
MLDSVRNASKQVMRDFNELQISNVKSADFVDKTYLRSKEAIYNCLYSYKQDYRFIYDDNTDQEINNDDYTWFVMPIECKENFANSIVYFAISVCLVYKNKAVAAVIYAPALKEIFWAEEKRGAFLEDFRARHIKMRMKSREGVLEGGLIDVSGNLLSRLAQNNSNIRSIGSTILGFAYLAAGRHNGIVYSRVNKYKILLGKLFLQESGGRLIEESGLIAAGNIK